VVAAAVPQQQQSPAQPASSDDWRSLLLSKSLEPGQLVKLTLKAKIKGDAGLVNIKPAAGAAPAPAAAAATDVTPVAGAVAAMTGGAAITTEKDSMPYKQLTVRPVMIRGKVLLQASLLTARQVSKQRWVGSCSSRTVCTGGSTSISPLQQCSAAYQHSGWKGAPCACLAESRPYASPLGDKLCKTVILNAVYECCPPALLHRLFTSQDITKNFTEGQAAAELGQLLHLPWSSASLITLTESVTVQVSRKGKTLVQVKPNKQQQPGAAPGSSNSKGALPVQQPPQQQEQQQLPELFGSSQQQQQQPLISLQHDRVKAVPINGSMADPFLFKIGLQTAEGRIKANMQVNPRDFIGFHQIVLLAFTRW
jgi:hypothetical protein